MEKGLLSVVITTYKRSFDILAQSLDSVLAQSGAELEVLVVDDNTPGNEWSRAVEEGLRAYPRVRRVPMPRNSGACAARNTGIMESRGEFVAFLDDDDLWLPGKAEKQLALFADPAVGLVFCQGMIFDDDDRGNAKEYYTTSEFNPSPTFADMLCVDRIGSTSQAVIRRECFSRAGLFDATLPARQDYEMWLRLTRAGYAARGVAEPLFMHRMHAGEQISKSYRRALEANNILREKYRTDYKRHRAGRFVLTTTLAGLNLRTGHRVRGLALYAKAFFCFPCRFAGAALHRKS